MSKLFKKIKFIIISMSLIIILIGILSYTDLFSHKGTSSLPSSTEVKEDVTEDKDNVDGYMEYDTNTKNILLMSDKSDSMVVASIDKENKNIELTPITNTGYFDRSNMEELLNSIEKNVNMNLDKFLQVDTSKLMNVISVLDHISVNIKSEDLELINNLIPKFYSEYENKSGEGMKLITKSGEQSINVYQAMAYASAVANDSSRQKEAMLSLVKNVKDLGFSKCLEIYSKVKPYIHTNLNIVDMINLASSDYEFQ